LIPAPESGRWASVVKVDLAMSSLFHRCGFSSALQILSNERRRIVF
jgi:hypothetical protein